MLSEFTELRRYLNDLIMRTCDLYAGKRNVTAWCAKFDPDEEILARATFQGVFSKPSVTIDTIIRITILVNRALKQIGEPPISPATLLVMVPSYRFLIQKLDGTKEDLLATAQEAEVISPEVAGQRAIEILRGLDISVRVKCLTEITAWVAETVAVDQASSLEKIQYLIKEKTRRGNIALRDLWTKEFSPSDLRWEVFESFSRGQYPTNPRPRKSEINALGYVLAGYSERSLAKFTQDDLEELSNHKRR